MRFPILPNKKTNIKFLNTIMALKKPKAKTRKDLNQIKNKILSLELEKDSSPNYTFNPQQNVCLNLSERF